jgi:hypothetical protein
MVVVMVPAQVEILMDYLAETVDLVVVPRKETLQWLAVKASTQEVHISMLQDKVMMAVGF